MKIVDSKTNKLDFITIKCEAVSQRQMYRVQNNPFQSSLVAHQKCVALCVSARIVFLLFSCVWDVSRNQQEFVYSPFSLSCAQTTQQDDVCSSTAFIQHLASLLRVVQSCK